jgi:ketosteroid isomerase-like protein
MARFVLLLSLLVLAACAAPNPPAAAPRADAGTSARDRAEVLASIQGFLDGLRAKDTTRMAQHVDSLTRITLLRPTPGGGTRVVVLTAAQFTRLATRPDQPGIDEPIRNPVVHVSGDLASVWAEYQVRRDGAVTHCGYDAFHLSRRDGRWKLLNVSDTYQQTGCGDPWPTAAR